MINPDRLVGLVEARMLSLALSGVAQTGALAQAIQRHFAAGGQRVRARFCLHASLRLGLAEHDAVTLAAACELLHNASLVQDDLLDQEAVRRGRPSIWATSGETVAVCAGDLLLAAAFVAVADLTTGCPLPDVTRLVFARTNDVIAGQVDEKYVHASRLDEYELLAKGKSASLLSLTLELPLLVAGFPGLCTTARAAVGHFAVAYQMLDDIDDFEKDWAEGALNGMSLLIRAGADCVDNARAQLLSAASRHFEAAEDLFATLPRDCALPLVEFGRARTATLDHLVVPVASPTAAGSPARVE